MTSRSFQSPRPGEEEGIHYHFSSREIMEKMKRDDEFLESAEFSGNMYGTSKKAVSKVLEEGKICILDIDVQGVKAIKAPGDIGIPTPTFVFIKPPSMEVLEQRLRARGTESDESLAKVSNFLGLLSKCFPMTR